MAAAHDRGKKALESKDYQKAIDEFSAAIKSNPDAPTYYLDRSSAYLRASTNNSQKALDDAEAGLILAKARDRGQFFGKAQFRRAIALYHLGRFKDAEKCFIWSKERDPSEKTLAIWEIKVKNKLDEAADQEVQVEQWPKDDVVKRARGTETGAEESSLDTKATTKSLAASKVTPAQPVAVTTPPSQIRHDWYQSSDTVTVSLMAKGVPKDKAVVNIEKGSVSISFPLPRGSDYDFSLDPLFAAIDPDASSFKVMSTKVELILKKASPGVKWHSLEGTSAINDGDTEAKSQAVPHAVLQGPSYPTSSKSGPKDWDKLARNISTKPKGKSSDSGGDSQEKKEDEEDLYVSDDEGGDPVNGFFKKLFKNADPDTRRAMMKSYTESNGTALSTNWSEVKQGKVETKPPDGMEAREWEK